MGIHEELTELLIKAEAELDKASQALYSRKYALAHNYNMRARGYLAEYYILLKRNRKKLGLENLGV